MSENKKGVDVWDAMIAWVCILMLVAYFVWMIISTDGFLNYGL